MAVVLVVDDDELVRELVAQVLRRAGHVVLPAANVAEAEGCADVYAIDLLVTDLKLEGDRGERLAAQLIARRPSLPVMTGQPERATTRDEVLGARVDLLPKPFTPAELLRRVQLALELA